MLGTLAKWLRIMGFDTLFDPDLNDHQLVRLARAGDRVLLTRDRELALRRGVQILLITSECLDDQIRQVLVDIGCEKSGLISDNLFSRCPVCNEALERMDARAARDRVPPYVARTHNQFSHCPHCNRVYWRGSHWRRMEERLAQLLKPIEPISDDGTCR
jgi:uncharacterized protein with PIN domain